MPLRILVFALSAILRLTPAAVAATYFVSPTGSDAAAGTSATTAWRTCAKVNAFHFNPGDHVLFQRGGQWRERLVASADGSEKTPIVYDAYGAGAKPRFWGSDLLDNTKFTTAGEHRFSYAIAARADSALCNHVFVDSTWAAGVLTITSTTDPRTDGKVYTACVRGNVILCHGHNHLVFRNLVVDETAGELTDGAVQGYGVRIEGSTNVLVESCEAYRCGRHHFGAINSTGFVGRHLIAAGVQPNTPGDNTAFVSYADAGAPVAHCTSVWDDVTASNLDDGKGGQSLTFVSHGEQQGMIVFENSTAQTKMSFMTAPVVVKHVTLVKNASIENWGPGVVIDGVMLRDSSAIDQWASDGTIQNCVAGLDPTGGGPTGYSAAVVIRDKARRNTLRFDTLVTGKFSGLMLVGDGSATTLLGNIMRADGQTIGKASGTLGRADVASADQNFYSTTATFAGQGFDAWRAAGFDQSSAVGDPFFVNAPAGDFRLTQKSPCRDRVRMTSDLPSTDAAGVTRSATTAVGAFEFKQTDVEVRKRKKSPRRTAWPFPRSLSRGAPAVRSGRAAVGSGGERNRVELDRDAIAEAAGLTTDDSAGRVPSALNPFGREEDTDPFTAGDRGLADGGQPAGRHVAERQVQERLPAGGDRVIQPLALHAGLKFFTRKDPAVGAGRGVLVGDEPHEVLGFDGLLQDR